MPTSHISHLHHKIIASKKELKEIYFNLFIQSFALGLINVFVPIYLLQLGFGWLDVGMYLLVLWITWAIVYPIASRVSHKIGIKHLVLFRTPILILFFGLLFLFQEFPFPIYLLGILFAISQSTYWSGMNYDFVSHLSKRKKGSETGILSALPRIAGVIAPISGALLLTAYGFPIVFLIVIILLFLAVIPLFWTKEIKDTKAPPLKREIKDFLKKDNRKFIAGNFVKGFESNTAAFIFPLFVFFLFNELISVGLASTFIGIGAALFSIFIGKKIDQGKEKPFLKIGVMVLAVLWMCAALITTELLAVSFGLLIGIVTVMYAIPFNEKSFERIKQGNITEGLIFREEMLCLGRIASVGLLILTAFNFEIVFITAGILMLYFLCADF